MIIITSIVFPHLIDFSHKILVYSSRSTLLPSATEQKDLNEMDESMGTSPPLELRRAMAAQRVAVPHSLQSPQDRATGNFNWKT